MKVAVVGSRSATLEHYPIISKYIPLNTTEIISGGAAGVDFLAEKYAQENKITLTKILPNYDKFGKTATLTRNIEIIKRSDYVLCFWDGKSRGTAHVVSNCIKMYKNVKIILLDNGSVLNTVEQQSFLNE